MGADGIIIITEWCEKSKSMERNRVTSSYSDGSRIVNDSSKRKSSKSN